MNRSKEYYRETKLFRFGIGTKDEPVQIEVEYFDMDDGEKCFNVSSDKCNVSAGSSGGWRAKTLEGKEKEAVKWIEGFLKDDGYTNIEVVRNGRTNN